MQSNLKVIALAAGISASALVACGERPKPAAAESAAQAAAPANPGTLARIDVNKGHPPDPTQVCKDADRKLDAIVIEMTDLPNLDPAHVTQWHEKTDKHGNEPDGNHIGDPLPPMQGGQTAADADAGPFLKNKNDVVLIQMKIKDQPELKFTSDPILTDDADNGKIAVASAEHGGLAQAVLGDGIFDGFLAAAEAGEAGLEDVGEVVLVGVAGFPGFLVVAIEDRLLKRGDEGRRGQLVLPQRHGVLDDEGHHRHRGADDRAPDEHDERSAVLDRVKNAFAAGFGLAFLSLRQAGGAAQEQNGKTGDKGKVTAESGVDHRSLKKWIKLGKNQGTVTSG